MTLSLRCLACGREYDAGPDEPWRCSCGNPLKFTERPLPGSEPPVFAAIDTREGLWTFEEFLPIGKRVTLGEGWTPLIDALEFECEFKLEYVFPTGSFKDRGAATTLSRALEVGTQRVIEDSSGNAGAAIATYAARAGVDAEIYVPAGAKESKLRAISRAGGEVVPVEGTREDVTNACIERVESGAGGYASHAWNPAFYVGTQTVALEIAAQRDWSAPDAVLVPLGHGTLFLGAYRGFRALYEAGWIEELPRLYGAQAAGYDPVARKFHSKSRGWDGGGEADGRNDLADGIRIREPARREEITEAIERTNGDALAIDEDATERALDRLHRAGFYTEPTCAVAPAALDELRERNAIDADEDVVVALTGSGLKS
ncbi:threonine synthase [Halobacteriales archaeon QS_3_64_16]|nr:MAG: threonine synthase [Halobacteriales archaeon QS_3_64_16]